MHLEGVAERLHRNWILTGLTAALSATGVLLFVTGARFGASLTAFGLLFGTLFFLRNAFPRVTPVAYRVSPETLLLDRETIASADILEAKALSIRNHAVVELKLRDRRTLRLRLPLPQLRDFTVLLQARRARFRLVTSFTKRFLAFFAVNFFLWLFTSIHLPHRLGALVMTLIAASLTAGIPSLFFAWLAGFIRGRVIVGTDGFATSWFFRERFIAFSKVASIQAKPQVTSPDVIDTVVELKSGRKVRLRPLEAPNSNAERGAEGRALFTHLAAAFEHSKLPSDGTPDVHALVERGSRSTKEWLSSIDDLVNGGGARYRVAPLSLDSLLAVATDPNASVQARVGAAAALIRTNDDELRVRVRVCAESCTDRDLREAMLALSEARDDETTETALAALRV